MARREHIPAKLRHEVFQRDNYRCRECGATNKETTLEIDHIVPVSKGGSNNISNLQTLCKKCNRSKHTRTWVGGVKDNKTNKIGSDRHFHTHSSKKSNKLGSNSLKYARTIPAKSCPNCNITINANDNICPFCNWDIKLGMYHIGPELDIKDDLNHNSSKAKKSKSNLLEDNIDELCRIYSIPKLGKKYVIKKILEEHTYEEVVEKLKIYGSTEQLKEQNERRKKYYTFMKFYDELDDFSVQCLCNHYGSNDGNKLINSLVDEFETTDSILSFIYSNFNFKRITFEKGLLKYHCYDGSFIYAKSLDELEKRAKMMCIIWDP